MQSDRPSAIGERSGGHQPTEPAAYDFRSSWPDQIHLPRRKQCLNEKVADENQRDILPAQAVVSVTAPDPLLGGSKGLLSTYFMRYNFTELDVGGTIQDLERSNTPQCHAIGWITYSRGKGIR